MLGVFVNLGGQIFSSEVLHLKETGLILNEDLYSEKYPIKSFTLRCMPNKNTMNNFRTLFSNLFFKIQHKKNPHKSQSLNLTFVNEDKFIYLIIYNFLLKLKTISFHGEMNPEEIGAILSSVYDHIS